MSAALGTPAPGRAEPDPAVPDLDERYGRTPDRARSNRRLGWIAGGAFVAVLGAWVVWAGLDAVEGGIDTLDVGHSVIDETAVSVTWQITMDPGAAATCAIEAQNELHGIVGWEIVEIPASDQRIRKFTEVVNTVEPPVTGLIYRCWPA